jgi:hypothetical protein
MAVSNFCFPSKYGDFCGVFFQNKTLCRSGTGILFFVPTVGKIRIREIRTGGE